MSITVNNGDGTFTVLAGHPAGIDAYLRAMERTEDINRTSRFKMHQRIRIKDDYPSLLSYFLQSAVYNYSEARMLAKDLVGAEVSVIAPEKLYDYDNEEKIYYTVAMDDGCFHVIPEHLLEEI